VREELNASLEDRVDASDRGAEGREAAEAEIESPMTAAEARVGAEQSSERVDKASSSVGSLQCFSARRMAMEMDRTVHNGTGHRARPSSTAPSGDARKVSSFQMGIWLKGIGRSGIA
jgi:hypothetical protein